MMDRPGSRQRSFQVGRPEQEFFVRLLVDDCCRCGDCVELCPVDAIAMDGDGLPSIEGSECICCGICYQWCPERAIIMPSQWHRHD